MFGVYIPTWDKAFAALPAQCVALTVLGIALGKFARQRHSLSRVIVALPLGAITGVLLGLLWVWYRWHVSEPGGASREQLLEWDLLGYVSPGWSAVAAGVGLVLGWLGLELVGALVASRHNTRATNAARESTPGGQ